MTKQDDPKAIVDSVLSSRKYHSLYRPTVERIVTTLSDRYLPKQLEHEVRRKLHQIWGAYFTRPNFSKLFEHFREGLSLGTPDRDLLLPLLRLQTSTNERIPLLPEFYSRIFELTGTPNTVVEYGCGVNALTYPWMGDGITYTGFDVDTELMNFINDIFTKMNVSKKAQVKLGDLLDGVYEKADVTLFLKVLVLFERQREGVSRGILEAVPSRYIVVSFPTKSITGKERGMKKHYTELFAELVEGTGWKTKSVEFESEIVFIIDKGGRSDRQKEK